MDDDNDFLARMTLHHVIEPADSVFCRLQEFAEPAELLTAIRNASLADLEPDPERRDRVADRGIGFRLRLDRVDIEASMAVARSLGARYLTPGRAHWPPGFDDLGPERPLGLWWLGSWLPGERTPVAAMVGARSCSGYGSYVAGALAAALGQAQVPVASGGALGIDAAAHRGALAVGGDTIAFLACGIDTATVVVEAAKRSGSLVTARRAADLGRPVLAVPGPITSEFSVGTHELIRDGAQVVESVQQLVAELTGQECSGLDRGSSGFGAPRHTGPPKGDSPRHAALTPVAAAVLAAQPAAANPPNPPNPLASLGQSEQTVLEALPTARAAGAQISDLVGATGIEPGVVFAGLGRLAALGLAAKNGSGWVLAPGQERVVRRYE